MPPMEDGFVDVSMAAFAQQFLVREAIGSSLKVTVMEVLDLDGFFWWVLGFGWFFGTWGLGVGGGDG